jgi:hypothetical protein
MLIFYGILFLTLFTERIKKMILVTIILIGTALGRAMYIERKEAKKRIF